MLYDADSGGCWLFPELQAVKSPNKKLSSYLSAVSIEAGIKTYKDVAVQLPEGVCAGGIRPGGCNVLTSQMPAEIAVHTTGHELKNSSSSLWEYVDANLSVVVVGGIVTAAWPPLTWGHLGMPPKPPSLEVLGEVGITMEKLEEIADMHLRIDTASHPAFQRGGRLRKLIHTCLAVSIMYHEERLDSGEMTTCCKKLEACVKRAGWADARTNILVWGRRLAAYFRVGNSNHVPKDNAEALNAVQQAVRTLGHLVGDMAQKVNGLTGACPTRSWIKTALLGIASPQQLSPGKPSPGKPGSPVPQTVEASDQGDDAVAGDPNPLEVDPNPLQDLQQVGTGDDACKDDITNSTGAVAVWYKCGENVPAGTSRPMKSKIANLVAWFTAAATDEELATLRDRKAESGAKTKIIQLLHTLVRQRLKAEFKAHDEDKPSLKQGKSLATTALESRLSELSKLRGGKPFTLAAADMKAFREAVSTACASRQQPCCTPASDRATRLSSPKAPPLPSLPCDTCRPPPATDGGREQEGGGAG